MYWTNERCLRHLQTCKMKSETPSMSSTRLPKIWKALSPTVPIESMTSLEFLSLQGGNVEQCHEYFFYMIKPMHGITCSKKRIRRALHLFPFHRHIHDCNIYIYTYRSSQNKEIISC